MRGRILAWPFLFGSSRKSSRGGYPSPPMTFARVSEGCQIGTWRSPDMQVEMRPITSIRPYENNPRLNDEAVDAVAKSIKEFGFRQPIFVYEQGVIIVGHTRYKAAL